MATINKAQIVIEAENKANAALQEVSKTLESVSSKAEKLEPAFKKMTAIGTAGFAAIAGGLFMVGNEFDKMNEAIAKGTGASGAKLKELEETAMDVATMVPQSFNEIGNAIAEVSTRFGELDHDALMSITKSMLDFSDVTGIEAVQAISNVSRVIGDWGLEVWQVYEVMDKLIVANQMSGVSVDALAQKVVQFGAPLRAMGFSIDQGIAMLSKWEKEGVNAELVLGSLRIAANSFAKDNIEMTTGLQQTIKAIQNARTENEALAIAQGVFGQKAALDMMRAIKENRFEIDEYVKALQNAEGALDSTDEASETTAEKFEVLRNQIMVGLKPAVDTVMESINKLLERVQPMIEKLGEWIEKNPKLAQAITLATLALFGLVAAAGALGLVLPAIITGFTIMLGPVGIIVAALAGLVAMIVLMVRNFEDAKNAVIMVWEMISQSIQTIWENLKTKAIEIWQGVIDSIRSAIENAKTSIGVAWDTVLKTVIDIINFYLQPFKDAFNFMVGLVEMAFNAMGTTLQLFIQSYMESVMAFWEWMVEVFTNYAQAVLDQLIFWGESLKEFIMIMVEELKFIWQTMWEFFQLIAQMVWATITGLIKNGFEAIKIIFTAAKEIIAPIWQAVWDGIVAIVNDGVEKAKAPIEGLMNWFREKIEEIKKLAASIGQAVSGALGVAGGFVSGVIEKGRSITGVQDAVITPSGQVIKTDPADYLIATKTPGALAGAGTIVINITGNEFLGSEGVAERIGNDIMKALKQNIKL